MRIKKDDTVIVLTGKDKGKTGKVLKAMPKDGKVIVEGVNIQTKHQKQTQKQQRSSIRKVRSMYRMLCTMMLRQKHRQESVTK